MKRDKTSKQAAGKQAALSPEVLRGIVGGAQPQEKRKIDGDMAAAMTAGMNDGHGNAPSATQTPSAQQAKTDAVAKAGNPDAKPPAESKVPLSKDEVKDIEKHFRENVGNKLPELNQKNEVKGTYERDLVKGGPGKWEVKSSAADSDRKDNAAAQQNHQPNSAPPSGQQPSTDYIKTAQKDAKTAFETGMTKALDETRKLAKDVRSAGDTLSRAQDAHDLSSATVKLAEAKLKTAVVFDKGQDEARGKLVDALVQHERNIKALADAKNTHDEVKQKHDGAQKALEGFKKVLSKTDDDLPRKAAGDDGTRPRANTAPAPLGANDGAQIAKQPEKTAEPEKSRTEQLKDEVKKDAWKNGVMVASKALEDVAKQAAKKDGTYEKRESSDVLAGGVSKDVTVKGKTTTEVVKVAQVKTESETESYSSALGSGKSASKSIRAETGYENKVTHDLGNGRSQTVTDKAYAGISGEAKAKYTITPTSIDAEAAAKAVAHAELRHTETTKIGIVETTKTTYVEGHAEAGVKAGAHLGFDGVKIGASASASASVSAGTSGEVKIGDAVKAGGDVKVFAEAMAEAKANAEVTFDPLKGTAKAKVDVGAMASAGIGVEGKGGLFNAKTGSGVGVGGSYSVGAIGVKFKPDLDIKDGKMDLKVELGGALGVGGNVNLQIKGDLNKAKDNFVASTKIPIPSVWIASSIVGFFS